MDRAGRGGTDRWDVKQLKRGGRGTCNLKGESEIGAKDSVLAGHTCAGMSSTIMDEGKTRRRTSALVCLCRFLCLMMRKAPDAPKQVDFLRHFRQ